MSKDSLLDGSLVPGRGTEDSVSVASLVFGTLSDRTIRGLGCFW